MIRVVLAAHTREVRLSLFLALQVLDDVSIVAAASSEAETLSYCRTFRPDLVILEGGLSEPGRDEFLEQLEALMGRERILVVDGAARGAAERHSDVRDFGDLAQLIQTVPSRHAAAPHGRRPEARSEAPGATSVRRPPCPP